MFQMSLIITSINSNLDEMEVYYGLS